MNICPLYSPLYKEFETISVLLSRLEARAAINIKLPITTNFLEIIHVYYGSKAISYSYKDNNATGKQSRHKQQIMARENTFNHCNEGQLRHNVMAVKTTPCKLGFSWMSLLKYF